MPEAALLVMDVQQGVVARYPDDVLLARLTKALAGARAAGMTVVHVHVALREGGPEVDDHNPIFSTIASDPAFSEGNAGTESHPAVAPEAGEILIVKRRVNAFYGTDLELVLRAQRVRTLVLCGIATSGVVLSTLRDAADRDFELVVLADACGERDPDVHRLLVERVFPSQARVLPVAEWVASLG